MPPISSERLDMWDENLVDVLGGIQTGSVLPGLGSSSRRCRMGGPAWCGHGPDVYVFPPPFDWFCSLLQSPLTRQPWLPPAASNVEGVFFVGCLRLDTFSHESASDISHCRSVSHCDRWIRSIQITFWCGGPWLIRRSFRHLAIIHYTPV